MTDYAPFPLIDLSGSPRERGRTHGKAAADRLRRGARMYAESLLRSGVDWPELERRAEALVPSIEKFDPTYIEEMRGIAEGANEPFAAVVLMNARTEIEKWGQYDYVIVNSDLDQSFPLVRGILATERLRRERVTGLATFVEGLLRAADDTAQKNP